MTRRFSSPVGGAQSSRARLLREGGQFGTNLSVTFSTQTLPSAIALGFDVPCWLHKNSLLRTHTSGTSLPFQKRDSDRAGSQPVDNEVQQLFPHKPQDIGHVVTGSDSCELLLVDGMFDGAVQETSGLSLQAGTDASCQECF